MYVDIYLLEFLVLKGPQLLKDLSLVNNGIAFFIVLFYFADRRDQSTYLSFWISFKYLCSTLVYYRSIGNVALFFMLDVTWKSIKTNPSNVHGASSSGHHGHGAGIQWTCLLGMLKELPVSIDTFLLVKLKIKK